MGARRAPACAAGATMVSVEVAGEPAKPMIGADGTRVPLLRPGFRPPSSHTGFDMLLWLLRGAYVALLLGMAVYSVQLFYDPENPTRAILVPLGILALGGVVGLFAGSDIVDWYLDTFT